MTMNVNSRVPTGGASWSLMFGQSGGESQWWDVRLEAVLVNVTVSMGVEKLEGSEVLALTGMREDSDRGKRCARQQRKRR